MTWIIANPPSDCGSSCARNSTPDPSCTSRPRYAAGGNESRVGFHTERRHTQLRQQLEELTSAEADVEHGIAADEPAGEIAVPTAQLLGSTTEVRRESLLAVPSADRVARHATQDSAKDRLIVVELSVLRGEPGLEIVELLEDVRCRTYARAPPRCHSPAKSPPR